MGADIKTLVERSQAMVERCGDGGAVRDNPAVRLGAALAGLARAGRDKVTLVISEAIGTLGPWIEQLLAESLGKDGQSIVPVVDEPLGNPVVYGGDRVFVALVVDGDTRFDDALAALDEAGHPAPLTTVQMSQKLIAEYAFKALISEVEQPHLSGGREHELMTNLILRRSTALAPREENGAQGLVLAGGGEPSRLRYQAHLCWSATAASSAA